MKKQTGKVVFVDIDDTLIRSFGSKEIPIIHVIDCIKKLFNENYILYAWSSVGAEYAEEKIKGLGLENYFTSFLPKPNIMIDDLTLEKWPNFILMHPNECR